MSVTLENPAPSATNVVRNSDASFRLTDPADINQPSIQVLVQIGTSPFVAAVVNGNNAFPYADPNAVVTDVALGFDIVVDFQGLWLANTLITLKIDADDGTATPLPTVGYSFTTGAVPEPAPLGLVQIARG